MTRARRVALALGVPACLALTAWGAFAIVGEIGQGHFPVSDTIPVSGGHVAVHVGGGNVLLEQGAAGQAKLTGTAHYSLVRPTFTAMLRSRVMAVIGLNLKATAQRGSRPTTPSASCWS